MPRRKPLQTTPSINRKPLTDFKYEINFEHSCSVPCVNPRCTGFMFLVLSQYGQHSVDELECFTCKKVRKLGSHDPYRKKPEPLLGKQQQRLRK